MAALAITTTSLPNGQAGRPYSATLATSGGVAPLFWSLTGGNLPDGLSLGISTGTIAGTPTSTDDHASLTLRLSDSGNPVQSTSVTLSLTVSPATISIALTPQRAGLTLGQKISLEVATNDYAGVTWTISPAGGSVDPQTSPDGTGVTLTAPGTAGLYSVKATSITDPTQSSSIHIFVSNLSGVYTYHNDLARDGVNDREYALSPANVNAMSFGKLFSCAVDGAIYAQPLWVSHLQLSGAVRNVVFVATQHDSLFAFDADAAPCLSLWKASLIDAAHGATSGETTVPSGTSGNLVGVGDGDITPEVGVTGTPVIDPGRGILYVVSKSMNAAGTHFYQRLHAIDLITGSEEPGSPLLIAATYPGSGDGGTTVTFNPRTENQRAGLALVNGIVYVAWGSHEDATPFYGWLMGYAYDGSSLSACCVLNVAPNAGYGGIWMSGGAPAADSSNNLYLITGNGRFDATSSAAPDNDYGDSFLKLSSTLAVLQYFTPTNQQSDELYNNDFGAGAAAILADLPAGSPLTHLAIAGGKDGTLYVLNRDSPGGFGDGHSWQQMSVGTEGDLSADTPGVLFSTGAFWNDRLYLVGAGGPLTAYHLDTSTARFTVAAVASAPTGGFGYPGSSPSVSAMGEDNGIVWALDNSRYCTNASPGCGPAVLHAYDATEISKELWNSALSSADTAGYAVKFVVPTVANGKVYVATRGNDSGGAQASSTVAGELDVYGLKPN